MGFKVMSGRAQVANEFSVLTGYKSSQFVRGCESRTYRALGRHCKPMTHPWPFGTSP